MSPTLQKQYLEAKRSLPEEYDYPIRAQERERRLEQGSLSYSVGVLILYLTFRENKWRMFTTGSEHHSLGHLALLTDQRTL